MLVQWTNQNLGTLALDCLIFLAKVNMQLPTYKHPPRKCATIQTIGPKKGPKSTKCGCTSHHFSQKTPNLTKKIEGFPNLYERKAYTTGIDTIIIYILTASPSVHI